MKQSAVSDLVTGTGRVTVRAIAAETGLSIATVSRVLNGGGNVASDTRQRVREVVDRLGDRAPEPRRRPQPRSTRPPVFVRCPYLLTDYFGHIVTSIAETLALHGQSMLLDAGDTVVKSAVVRKLPRRGDAYGALLILPRNPALTLRRWPPAVTRLWWWTRGRPPPGAWCRSRRRTSPAPGPSPGT
jgi:LacI family transcriptional regulator